VCVCVCVFVCVCVVHTQFFEFADTLQKLRFCSQSTVLCVRVHVHVRVRACARVHMWGEP